jgi:hypothetical protein
MAADRFRRLDYRKTDVARLRHARCRRETEIHAAARPLTPARFDERLDRIDKSVSEILVRGGRVVFIRLPSSGAVAQMEARTWPRAAYWDRLAARTRARTIHYKDHPQLEGFDCPDGSHLGVDDARRFSVALVEVLKEEMGDKR